MVFARLYMFLFLTHFRPTCSRIYTFAILYSTAKVAKVYSTRTNEQTLVYSIEITASYDLYYLLLYCYHTMARCPGGNAM